MKLYRYCKLAENKKCRFGYPKQPAPRTEFVEDTCIYERGVQDMNMNNYNPFLLATWRANMDIQWLSKLVACFHILPIHAADYFIS